MTSPTTKPDAVQPEAEAGVALFDGWFDPIEAALRDRARAFIETMISSELDAALARVRYARRPAAGEGGDGAAAGVVGHRHGRRTRTLTGTFGTTEVTVPRARLVAGDGRTSEWKSKALRSYQRRTKAADALIAGAYLAGTNTRRVRRALAALFGEAVGKDVVSRTWRKAGSDWDAWNGRDLAAEPMARLILDGTVARVRLDRKATSVSLLVALGVRRDGQKVLLAVKTMGGESEAAWRALLDDLVTRGLRPPGLIIVDGAPGLEKALAALWPAVPAQRCTVHTIRTQSTIRLREALTPRRGAAQGDDMADLQAAIADDDALDHELQDRLLVGQRRLVQAAADAGAERRRVRPRRFGSQPLLAEADPVFPLPLQGPAFLRELPAPFGQLGQGDRIGLVGVQQAPVGPRDPIQPAAELLVRRPVPGRAGLGGDVLELRQQPVRVGEQAGDVLPDGALDLLGPDAAARAGGGARAQDAVLAVALVVLPRRFARRRRAGDAVHGQAAEPAGEQAP